MSAVPPPYTPTTSFATEAQQPIVTAGLPGAELDQEFVNIQTTVGGLRSRLSQIQRDDGALANSVVSLESLSSEALLVLGDGAFNYRGEWGPETEYALGDVYSRGYITWLVSQDYTSGVEYDDTDTSNASIIGNPPDAGYVIRDVFSGDGTTTHFELSAEAIYEGNLHVYVDGVIKLGQGIDYSMMGATIDFVVAPPIGTNNILTEVGQVVISQIAEVADGSVTTAKLAGGSVTSAKIAAGAVATAGIADGAVTEAKLANSSVTGAKLQNGTVTGAKLANASVEAAQLADGAVTSAKIADGGVTTNKIGTGAVATGSIADSAVTTGKIASGAVATASIADSNVTTAKIADNAVTTAKIADAGVTPAKLSGGQSGTAPVYGARAWATIDGVTEANKTGTYSQVGTVVTVSVTAHGLRVGHVCWCDFTSGTATDAEFVVATVIDANNFTVARSSATTSGNVTLNFVTVTASGNVSSVAKIATGDYAINFTTDMPSSNYATVATSVGYSATLSIATVCLKGSGATPYAGAPHRRTASTVSILTGQSNNTNLVDMKELSLVFFC